MKNLAFCTTNLVIDKKIQTHRLQYVSMSCRLLEGAPDFDRFELFALVPESTSNSWLDPASPSSHRMRIGHVP
jgi:hypothetical protein